MTRHEEIETASPATPSAIRRLLGITLAWVLMGLMLGLLSGRVPGVVGLAAALTAGTIVMAPVGLLLGLLGGRWDESLLGGMFGMALGLAAASLQGLSDPRETAAIGLTCGAFFGATALTVFYRVPRLIAMRVAARGMQTAN